MHLFMPHSSGFYLKKKIVPLTTGHPEKAQGACEAIPGFGLGAGLDQQSCCNGTLAGKD